MVFGMAQALVPSMAEPHQRITINPQPVKAGDEWHVVATWPSGHPEHITGFKTEAEAREWITGDGAIRGRGAISMAIAVPPSP